MNLSDRIAELLRRGLTRVHLGCGANYRDGYINIDLPTESTVQQRHRAPDIIGDFTLMQFPDGSLDEIVAEHLFEHFQRWQAFSLLVRWRRWLKPGGALRLAMPDIEACLSEFLLAPSDRQRQLIRHLWGSHEASWATHHEGWMPTTMASAFAASGFRVTHTERTGGRWPAFTMIAVKEHEPSLTAIRDYFAAMCPGDKTLVNQWLIPIERELSAQSDIPRLPQPATPVAHARSTAGRA